MKTSEMKKTGKANHYAIAISVRIDDRHNTLPL